MIKSQLILSGLLLTSSLPAYAVVDPLTPQSAEYQVNYGSIELGRARYQLPAPEGNIYHYRFDSDLSLLMLTDKRTIKSTFSFDGKKLTPMRYIQQRTGTGSDFSDQTAYVLDQKLVHSSYKDKRDKFPYTDDLYDPLSAQLQFRLDITAGAKTMHYDLLKSGKVDDYDFKVLGQERITLESGSYDTVKIEVVRESTKRQTFFWMAPQLAYLPVQLTHYEKGSKQLDIKLLNYQFEQNAIGQTRIKGSISEHLDAENGDTGNSDTGKENKTQQPTLESKVTSPEGTTDAKAETKPETEPEPGFKP
ncbi:DUF3108 domain-containing protein [Shewanella sp. AS1]|uniref:DUF3108 domain-containing protein n=1 Tax=Shewanella sp. AS1 TaxID=2907626 RepID=UPI002DD44081|nr:DUF3108 domain-containing protein [Shewanella sp. AS1]